MGCELKKLCEEYAVAEKEESNASKKRKKVKRSCWVQSYLQCQMEHGNYDNYARIER